MRKVLAGVLCACVATVPAVAFAATDDDDNKTTDVKQTTEAPQLREAAKQKLQTAVKRAKADRKAELRAKRREAAAPVQATGAGTAPPHLEAIAACESGGDPSAIGGGGAYRGKYQFDYATWASVGGSGDPAAAPEAEQDKRAAMLYAQAGASPWPVCGQ